MPKSSALDCAREGFVAVPPGSWPYELPPPAPNSEANSTRANIVLNQAARRNDDGCKRIIQVLTRARLCRVWLFMIDQQMSMHSAHPLDEQSSFGLHAAAGAGSMPHHTEEVCASRHILYHKPPI